MSKKKVFEKTVADLKTELLALLREQFNLRIQSSISQRQQTHTLRAVRRDIARLKTILTERANLI